MINIYKNIFSTPPHNKNKNNCYPELVSEFQDYEILKQVQNDKISIYDLSQKTAFTLAEVLITLVIIGIIAALTVPNMIQQYQWKQYRAGALKAISNLNQTVHLYQIKEGHVPACGYWEKTPIALKPDESSNGKFSDCGKIYDFLLKEMKIVKSCESDAYSNGCIPDYKGIDTIYKDNNPHLSDDEVTNRIGGVAFKKNQIIHTAAFITTDGIIYFPFNGKGNSNMIAFDSNGFKGPNKWGYDVFALQATIKNSYDNPKYVKQAYDSMLVEPGGKTLKELILKE